jgi:UDP-N-acetylglucosamine diphosphorylase/glucosamine-1-phosphate N-acetyltransferase
MRAGAELIERRWARALSPAKISFCGAAHLAGFSEFDGPRAAAGTLPTGTIVANSRCVLALATQPGDADLWRVGEHVAAIRLPSAIDARVLADGTRTLDSLASKNGREARLAGRWLQHSWDIVAQLPEQLSEDVIALAAERPTADSSAGERIGSHPVVVEEGAVIEPFVVFDTTAGGVVVRRGAHIESFSRIAGPCVIGERTHVFGGRVNGCAIGEDCRVHGDVSTTVFIGHGNKGHEGFVGHSVIGRWANLGAGTTTSNLKNSYGAVKMWTARGERDTGLTFLGSLIGDHAKLGIGTMLGTGTLVGAGANVFGTVRPPKRVPPFAWGDAPPYETFSLEKFLEVAERVMKRRNCALDESQRALLSTAHALGGTAEW